MIVRLPPTFVPHPLYFNGHLQTLAGLYLRSESMPYAAKQHRLTLCDGDQIILHDDCPPGWKPGGRTALMIHGLCGGYLSGYFQRIVPQLNARGIRTFRMDLRGCGAGVGLCRRPYHSGLTPDVAEALTLMAKLCPGSPATLIGFSLGGNIVLKYLGEYARTSPMPIDCAAAVCPPIDLAHCVRSLLRSASRIYDRYLLGRLLRQFWENRRKACDPPPLHLPHTPRTIYEFDNMITAPLCGFSSADEYYRKSSSNQFMPLIAAPTLVLTAEDDPMVPVDPFDRVKPSKRIQLEVTPSGGHLGFIGRPDSRAGLRWMDWRVVKWVTELM